jgi:uncharacterized coiled-coil protein SlyX
LAQLPETADQRRLRLLAHEMAKLQRRLGQLELANAWLVQVLQHFVEDAAGTDRVNADQLREDWNKLAEAFRNLSDETLAQPAEPGPA